MIPILVVNSGSSSVKYQVQDVDSGDSLLEGLIERVTDHDEAFKKMLAEIADSKIELSAVGHRVVHGGAKFSSPTVISEEVLAEIEALVPLPRSTILGTWLGFVPPEPLFLSCCRWRYLTRLFTRPCPPAPIAMRLIKS